MDLFYIYWAVRYIFVDGLIFVSDSLKQSSKMSWLGVMPSHQPNDPSTVPVMELRHGIGLCHGDWLESECTDNYPNGIITLSSVIFSSKVSHCRPYSAFFHINAIMQNKSWAYGAYHINDLPVQNLECDRELYKWIQCASAYITRQTSYSRNSNVIPWASMAAWVEIT